MNETDKAVSVRELREQISMMLYPHIGSGPLASAAAAEILALPVIATALASGEPARDCPYPKCDCAAEFVNFLEIPATVCPRYGKRSEPTPFCPGERCTDPACHPKCKHFTSGEPESPEQQVEHFIQAAIDRAPEPLRRLGEYLSQVLDEDQWATAEKMLNGTALASGEAARLHVQLSTPKSEPNLPPSHVYPAEPARVTFDPHDTEHDVGRQHASPEPDTSDIPEVGEEWFKRAKLLLPEDQVEHLSKVYAEATGYYVPFHKGLSSESANKIREGIRAVMVAQALYYGNRPRVRRVSREPFVIEEPRE